MAKWGGAQWCLDCLRPSASGVVFLSAVACASQTSHAACGGLVESRCVERTVDARASDRAAPRPGERGVGAQLGTAVSNALSSILLLVFWLQKVR